MSDFLLRYSDVMNFLDVFLAGVTAFYALWIILIARELIRCRKSSGAGRADLRRVEPSHNTPQTDPHLSYLVKNNTATNKHHDKKN